MFFFLNTLRLSSMVAQCAVHEVHLQKWKMRSSASICGLYISQIKSTNDLIGKVILPLCYDINTMLASLGRIKQGNLLLALLLMNIYMCSPDAGYQLCCDKKCIFTVFIVLFWYFYDPRFVISYCTYVFNICVAHNPIFVKYINSKLYPCGAFIEHIILLLCINFR